MDVSFTYMFGSNELIVEASITSSGVEFSEVTITNGISFVDFNFDDIHVTRRTMNKMAMPVYESLEDALIEAAFAAAEEASDIDDDWGLSDYLRDQQTDRETIK